MNDLSLISCIELKINNKSNFGSSRSDQLRCFGAIFY